MRFQKFSTFKEFRNDFVFEGVKAKYSQILTKICLLLFANNSLNKSSERYVVHRQRYGSLNKRFNVNFTKNEKANKRWNDVLLNTFQLTTKIIISPIEIESNFFSC